jgi:putative ABC transport system substrate-binding protein
VIDRRRFLAASAAMPLASAWPAFAQQARIPRIGYLVLPSLTELPSRERQAFLDGLRELGYVPGSTIEIVYASAENEAEFLEAACADLVRLKVDLIVTAGALASIAAQKVTRSVPIVMLALGDAIGIGLVKSLARPGGNLTGVSFLSTELAGKRMQLLKDLLPGAKRIAVMWNPENPNSLNEKRAAIAGARTLKLATQDLPVASDRALAAAMKSLESHRPDALYVTFEGGLIAEHRSEIAEFGMRHRVPIVSGWTSLTEAGALFSYAPDIPVIFHRAAHYVQRILQGAKAGDLPIELPTKVELVLNAKTARALGVKFPQELLLLADRVIE